MEMTMATNDTKMTKSERDELLRLIRAREKTLKSVAKQRSAELLADFDSQLAAEYRFDDDAVWEAAAKLAEAEVAKAQERVAARCAELGIPRKFAPSLKLFWSGRGYDNSVKQRREELRRAAISRIEAIEQAAVVQIEMDSVNLQQQIAVSGLTSEAALVFAKALPSVECLMPAVSYSEIAGEADPPVVEQLITPNALRPRRFRDRQRALRNAEVTAGNAACHDGGGDEGGSAA
jgi:hypothetical protein